MAGLKLKASSLIEVLVAMVIISIISSIAIMIYLNTLTSLENSKQSNLEMKIKYHVEQVAQQKNNEGLFLIDEEGDRIKVDVYPHDEIEHLWIIKGSVADSLDFQQANFQRLMYAIP